MPAKSSGLPASKARASANSSAPPPASIAALRRRGARQGCEDRRRQSRRFSPLRHRLYSRRSPRRGRVPQSDAAREFQPRLSGVDFAPRRGRPRRRGRSQPRRSSTTCASAPPSAEIQAVRIVRRQSAKGAVRPRDIGETDACFWWTSRPRASISARAAKSTSACAPSPIRAWRCWCRLRTASSSKACAIGC